MEISGHIKKMHTVLAEDGSVEYFLPLDDQQIPMNPLIGKKIRLKYNGDIHCLACGKKTKKSYSQGYCYPCMQRLAECDMCMLKPETCHYAQGTCRDPSWGEQHCFQNHTVYLANTSGLKVGITRQTPSRWIDQGATQALAIFQVENRLLSGLIECVFKQHISDRTDWRKMLKGSVAPQPLYDRREQLLDITRQEIDNIINQHHAAKIDVVHEQIVELHYPVQTYPTKISSYNFDKTTEINGLLQGIKGQYLLLDSGVLNIRKFTSYSITISH